MGDLGIQSEVQYTSSPVGRKLGEVPKACRCKRDRLLVQIHPPAPDEKPKWTPITGLLRAPPDVISSVVAGSRYVDPS